MIYLLYGRRTGLVQNGVPIYDKTFRALDANGVRVNHLADAMAYATKEDALEILENPVIKENIDKGLIQFEVRRG